MAIDFTTIPKLPEGVTRTLYVRCCGSDIVEDLESKGYTVVDLFTMPRGTTEEKEDYLGAKLQGLEEGTIPDVPGERKALELQMRAAGMLHKQGPAAPGEGVSEVGSAIMTLLDWSSSNHTLRDNSTVQSAVKKED